MEHIDKVTRVGDYVRRKPKQTRPATASFAPMSANGGGGVAGDLQAGEAGGAAPAEARVGVLVPEMQAAVSKLLLKRKGAMKTALSLCCGQSMGTGSTSARWRRCKR
jgi:hypothetical protein